MVLKSSTIFFLSSVFLFHTLFIYAAAPPFKNGTSLKTNGVTASEYRLSAVHDANKLNTLFYNYGSVGRPNTEPSFNWPSGSLRGYAYEAGLMIGAEVKDSSGNMVHIF